MNDDTTTANNNSNSNGNSNNECNTASWTTRSISTVPITITIPTQVMRQSDSGGVRTYSSCHHPPLYTDFLRQWQSHHPHNGRVVSCHGHDNQSKWMEWVNNQYTVSSQIKSSSTDAGTRLGIRIGTRIGTGIGTKNRNKKSNYCTMIIISISPRVVVFFNGFVRLCHSRCVFLLPKELGEWVSEWVKPIYRHQSSTATNNKSCSSMQLCSMNQQKGQCCSQFVVVAVVVYTSMDSVTLLSA